MSTSTAASVVYVQDLELNEGAFHVYIDPRRLREVRAIINLEGRGQGAFG